MMSCQKIDRHIVVYYESIKRVQQSAFETCRFLKFSFLGFYHTEIHILFLSLPLTLTIHNKQPNEN